MSQSVRCEICDIVCTSVQLYAMHVSGKKHLKTLKKTYNPLTTPVHPISQIVVHDSTLGLTHGITESSIQVATSAPMSEDHLAGKRHRDQGTTTSTMGGHDNIEGSSVSPGQDLGTKKQKVIQCGAVVEVVHACTICNIVCNSEVAFAEHIAGKRHIAQASTASAMDGHDNTSSVSPGQHLDTKTQKLIHSGADVGSVRACTFCNVVCNSEVVFADHVVGKRHIAQVLKAALVGGGINLNQQTPPMPPKLVENIEAKIQRIKGSGTPAAAVRVCDLCDIVCNSDSVFTSHLVGQKHASTLRKMAQSQTPIDPTAPPAATGYMSVS